MIDLRMYEGGPIKFRSNPVAFLRIEIEKVVEKSTSFSVGPNSNRNSDPMIQSEGPSPACDAGMRRRRADGPASSWLMVRKPMRKRKTLLVWMRRQGVPLPLARA